MSKASMKKKTKSLKNKKTKKVFINEEDLIINLLMGETNWDKISKLSLSFNFMEKYKDNLNWDHISKQNITKKVISNFKDYLNWRYIINYGKIDNDIYSEYFDYIYTNPDFYKIFDNVELKITCKTIEKYVNYYDDKCWYGISKYKFLDEWFINKYRHKLNWRLICENQHLTENLILSNKCFIKYNNIRHTYKLSNNFIKKEILPYINENSHIANLIVDNYFGYLGYEIIENVNNPSLWKMISYHCKLSDTFILKNINKLNKHGLKSNFYISASIKEKLNIYRR